MIELSRRSFFSGTLAFTALAVLPSVAKSLGRPMIWCDGIHCDADGLEAMTEGAPFQVSRSAGGLFENHGSWRMVSGHVSLKRPLQLRNIAGAYIRRTNFKALPGFNENALIHFHCDTVDSENPCYFGDCHFAHPQNVGWGKFIKPGHLTGDIAEPDFTV